MGSVPMLIMMVAAVGVTYGWQPDPNGDHDSSVQYMIQVSPYELEQMEQVGGITMVIDPVVQGHLSRIVVRVGDQDLPRELPEGLRGSQRTASLKPDPQSGGLSLPPSLQNSVNQITDSARQTVANQFDQAGRQLTNQARSRVNSVFDKVSGQGVLSGRSEPNDRDLVAPPSTRSGTQRTGSQQTPFSAPDFATRNAGAGLTGNQANASTGFAGTRPNGPSTSSAGRTNNWNFGRADTRLTATTTSNTSGRLNGPSTSDRGGLSPTGLSASDQFGRTPGSTLDGRTTNRPFRTVNSPTTNRADSSAFDRPMTQLEQVRLDRERRRTISQTPTTSTSPQGNPSFSNSTSLVNDASNLMRNQPRFSNDRTTSAATPPLDPRLTSAQLAAGGVGFDLYDRLIDRNEQLILDPERGNPSTRASSGQTNSRQGSAYDQQERYARAAPNQSFVNQDRDPRMSRGDERGDLIDSRVNRPLETSDVRFDPNQRADSRLTNRYEDYRDGTNPLDGRRFTQAETSRRRSPEYDEGRLGADYPSRANRDRYPDSRDRRGSFDDRDERYDGRGFVNDRDSRDLATRRSLDPVSASDQVSPRTAQITPALSPSVTPPSVNATASIVKPSSRLSSWFLVTSFVVNLFFLYWFHGMRQRYRELVLAKRMVDSAATAG